MAASRTRSPQEIRASIEANRAELAHSLVRLRGEVAEVTDWRRQIVTHQKQVLIGAAAAGFLVGGGLAAVGGWFRRRRWSSLRARVSRPARGVARGRSLRRSGSCAPYACRDPETRPLPTHIVGPRRGPLGHRAAPSLDALVARPRGRATNDDG